MTEQNAKKTFSRIGLALTIGILSILAVGLLASALISGEEEIAKLVDAIGPSLTLLLTDLPNVLFLLVFWLLVRTVPRTEWVKEKLSFRTLLQLFAMMYAVSTVLNILGTALTKAAPAGETGSLEMIDKIVTSGLPVGIAMVALIAPVIEELIFRKLMLDRIRNYGETTAIVFSAFCFGLYHGNLTQFLYAFSVGLFLGYVYCRTGKVLITIVMHALLNAISSSLMLIAPMLQQDRTAAVILLIPAFLLVAGLFVSGWIVLIRSRKRGTFRPDNSMETCIPRNEVLHTVWLNPGVVLFVLYLVVSIVLDLLNIRIG